MKANKGVSNEKIKIIPLGGLEHIGMNITCIEYEDSIIVIDCGLSFPDEDMLGIDLVIPDVTYLKDNIEKVKGFVITHGHEDHIGALPYVHILGSKDPANHTGIVSFTIDGVHPHDVSEILSSDGIDVRAGHHCAQPLLEYLGVRSSTRASMMFYNTPEEIDALIESVSTIRRRMGYGE